MRVDIIVLLLTGQFYVIHSSDISVPFNGPILLDDSTLHWSSFDLLQCTVTSTETSTITTISTTAAVARDSVIVYSCHDGSYGLNCNITSDICIIANPCLNDATCYSNRNLTAGYTCRCASGFAGDHCEFNQNVCTEDTCWNNGTCSEINITTSSNYTTTFVCQCAPGYEGVNCEVTINMCTNVTCQNNGICVSSYPTWSCQCLDSTLYAGTYCENKHSGLVAKEALSKSFAACAIGAISGVFVFVIVLDALKYVFNIDPADRELHRIRLEQEKEDQKRFTKKKPDKTTVAPYLIS